MFRCLSLVRVKLFIGFLVCFGKILVMLVVCFRVLLWRVISMLLWLCCMLVFR